MSLDAQVVSRFQTSVAALQPQFDAVALRLFDRLRKDCPHAARLVPNWTRRTRFNIAGAFAEIVKNVARPGDRLRWLQAAFAAAGVSDQDLRIIQKALMHEVQAAAGPAWNTQLESDWNAVLASLFSQLRSAPTQALRAAA